jgi:hypothetical protein
MAQSWENRNDYSLDKHFTHFLVASEALPDEELHFWLLVQVCRTQIGITARIDRGEEGVEGDWLPVAA